MEKEDLYVNLTDDQSVALDELESDRSFLNPIFEDSVVDRIIELERKDQREISIRPHPHEFYLYFDV